MAVATGKSGDITFASGYVAHCNSWTVEITQDAFEDTEIGDSWRTKVPGLLNWTGSFSCKLDEGAMTTTVTGLGMAAAAATATFLYDTGSHIEGTIIITGATLNVSTDGANSIEFTFEGSGAPDWTTTV